MIKGDILLIPFTNLSGDKVRPALVLVATNTDITVCFITTQLKWEEPTDVKISPSELNGIKKVSLIRLSKMATIDKELALGKLGVLNSPDIEAVNNNLKVLLQLN